ncbi:MAG: type I addiction module toxin, SymE family [Williamsia sp.]|nr:type I addiction module toxin, SymE family [Williamsia sp.]
MEKRTKKVKLHAKYRALRNSWPAGKEVPWLNVSGIWLEAAGFKKGDQVEITIEQNTLIIKNCSANGDQRD